MTGDSQDQVAELGALIRDELFARAPRVPREVGQPVQSGDEVLVDLLAFREGQLVPFSAQADRLVVASAQEPEGELARALVDALVGEPLNATLFLPDDHPIAELRGESAEYAVSVKEARAVQLPQGNPLEALGLSGSREEGLRKLAETLAARRHQQRLRESALGAIDQLFKERPVEVPDELVDGELQAAWRDSEGKFLQSADLEAEARLAAMKAWVTHPDLREAARRRIAFTLLLNAFIEAQQITLEPGEWEEVLELSSRELEIAPGGLREGFEEAPEDREAFKRRLVYFKALQQLLNLSGAAPGAPPGKGPSSPPSE